MNLPAVSRKSLLALSGVVVLVIIDVCHAVDVLVISSTGCIDKSGFEKCLSDAADESTICIKAVSGEFDSTDNCGYVYRINQMGCYMSSCWKKIYSWEYAALAAEYTAGRNLVTLEPIPF